MTNNDNLTDILLGLNPYDGSPEAEQAFFNALREELVFHYENNESYRHFCTIKRFNPYLWDGDIKKLPPIAVSVFKELGFELASVPKEEVHMAMQSSATSGVPSTIMVDKTTAKRQSKAMVKVVGDFIGKARLPFLIMDIDPRSGGMARKLLGARFAAVTGYLKFANKTGYFLKTSDEGVSYFDVESMKNFLAEIPKNQPVVVFGFTYILYQNVLKAIEDSGDCIKLPEGSKIIHIGGWKKLESEKIDKQLFNCRLAKAFGIEPSDVIDIYGFTEQMGLNYPDCECGCKHTSSYVRVIARDPSSRQVLPPGHEGMLEFISPVPHSYPGNVVLTDDIGIIEEGKCPYGRPGTRFRIVGRMKKAEARGCGDILSAKLMFHAKKATHVKESVLDIQYFQGHLKEVAPENQILEIVDILRSRQSILQNESIEDLINLISKTAEIWLKDSRYDFLRDKGRLFLTQWCSANHLREVAREGLRGNLAYADGFETFADSKNHYLKANPKGLVCHWMAGNVQILGMFALVQAIITKNVNLIKVAAKDEGVFRQLIQAFEEVEIKKENGETLSGKDIASTIAVVYFPRTASGVASRMSEKADVRIAWGGKEAVETVASYPSAIDSRTVIFGPKLSFAVVAKEALASEHEARKLARRVSVDVSVFDQYGCASPHNLYIERNGNVSPERFCELLAEVFPKTEIQIPKGNMDIATISAIHSVRGVYDFKGSVYGNPGMTWTVLLDPDKKLAKPVYSRVLFVHAVDSIMDAIDEIKPYIQSIGIEAPLEKAMDFATVATAKGVSRLPKIGRMLNFEMPWDGLFLIDSIVRWNTLFGPTI